MCDFMSSIVQMVTKTRGELYAWLKINKITQEECAEMLGVSRSHFNKVLNGTTMPSIKLLERMMQIMEEK